MTQPNDADRVFRANGDVSPFYCAVCGESRASLLAAVFCCICDACGHRFDMHRVRSPRSIVPEAGPCWADYCGCSGFGGNAGISVMVSMLAACDELRDLPAVGYVTISATGEVAIKWMKGGPL